MIVIWLNSVIYTVVIIMNFSFCKHVYSIMSYTYSRKAVLHVYIAWMLLCCIILLAYILSTSHIYSYTPLRLRIQVDQLRDRSQALVSYATLACNKLNKADTLKALTLMQAQLK